MQTIKRIEILLPEALVQPCKDILNRETILAYTVSVGLSVKNRQGLATAGLCDAAIILLCRPDSAEALCAKLKPFLTRFAALATMAEVEALNLH
ncbi:MAG: hypothetical protein INF64_08765 [Roseomonas sp.]|nr:hypothetical protein [Roseomonas sp.]